VPRRGSPGFPPARRRDSTETALQTASPPGEGPALGDTVANRGRTTVEGVPGGTPRSTPDSGSPSGVRKRGKALPVAKPLEEVPAGGFASSLEELLGPDAFQAAWSAKHPPHADTNPTPAASAKHSPETRRKHEPRSPRRWAPGKTPPLWAWLAIAAGFLVGVILLVVMLMVLHPR
jgi:hypothetical protein